MKRFLFFLFLFFISKWSIAQTTLSAGDIAIIKFVTGSGTDNVSLLVLKELSCGTQFIFTDNNWNATTPGWTCNDDEFAVGFTCTSIIRPGTIINLEVNPIGNLTVTPWGSLTYTALGNPWGTNAGLNSGGDNGFVLQGTRAAPLFIYGLRHSGTFAFGGTCSSKDNTGLPAALTLSSTAIEMSSSQSYWQYNCSNLNSGTSAVLLAAISTKTNWSSSSSAQSFTVTNAPYNPTGALTISGPGCGCQAGCNLTSIGGPNCGAGVTGNCTAGSQTVTNDIAVPTGCTYHVAATTRLWSSLSCGLGSGADADNQVKVDIPAGPKPFVVGASDSEINDSYTLTGPGTIRITGIMNRADEIVLYRIMSSPCSTCGVFVLPIELSQFNANILDDNVVLKWTTESETNNDYFSIERSSDGNDWTLISIVKSLKESHSSIHYSSYDFSPINGLSYYRLKQTDVDGTSTYSGIVSVNYDQKVNAQRIVKRISIYGTELDENAKGLLIEIYEDGTAKKIYK